MKAAQNFFKFLVTAITVDPTTYIPCSLLCVNRASPRDLAEIKICLYKGPTLADYTCVEIDNAVKLLDEIDNSKPTAMYIHGWLGNSLLPTTKAILSAYLHRGDHNVLLFDWSNIAIGEYTYCIRSLQDIGRILAMRLNDMVERGLNRATLYLVGHSLGAQIASAVGKRVNFTLEKIIGLDPAGPGFYFDYDRMISSGAKFVLTIAGDKNLLGSDTMSGHANFYPNGGAAIQPGCTKILLVSDACSHLMAAHFYAMSLINENLFFGRLCDSYVDFKAGKCDSNEIVKMGLGTPATTRGEFYLDIENSSQSDKSELSKALDFLIPYLDSVLGSQFPM